MALRMLRTNDLKIVESSTRPNVRYERNPKYDKIQCDEFRREHGGDFTVAAGETQALDFGDVAVVRGVHMRLWFVADTDSAELLVNGNPAMIIRPIPGQADDARVADILLDVDLTTLSVRLQAGQATVSGVYTAWGDVVV